MKNKIIWTAVAAIILVVLLIAYNPEDSEGGVVECQTSEQCYPSTCCHAPACVSESERPDCSGVLCTFSIEPGTVDEGSCECVNNKCELVIP